MKRILLLLFGLTAIGLVSFAQKITISGTITDMESGETMLSANVYDENSYSGAVSNNYGYYVLHVNKGPVKLVCSYVGYLQIPLEFVATKDTTINLEISRNLKIEEVVVTDKGPQQTVQSSQMSRIELKVADIKSAPVLLGEVDIIKTLQTLPGVQGGTEGSAGFFVRGGAPDQNLILLDGVPVYNVNHLFGFFSVFNADAIKNVSLIKGGFPARYGGRLSSVVDIRMKEGDMKKFHGEGSIGLLSSKLTLEGPIIKDKASFLISGRRTYYDLFTLPFQASRNKRNPNDKLNFGAFFYDLNAKVNYKVSDRDRIYLSAYLGKDKFNLKSEYKENYENFESQYNDDNGLWWGNVTSALRWNHKFSNRLFSNLTATFSDYTFSIFAKGDVFSKDKGVESSGSYDLTYYSRIRNYGLKYDFDFPVTENHYLRFGISNTYYQFSPGVGVFREKSSDNNFSSDTSIGTKNIPGDELSVYIEDEWSIGSRIKANVGAHFSTFLIKGKKYYSPEPRLSLRYLATDNLSIKGSYVWMTQYINLLTNSTVGLPTDLWIPSTEKLLPQKSWQGAIGLAYNYKDAYELTIEGYYKEMTNMVEFAEGFGFFSLGSNDIEKLTTQGRGYSYGSEFMLRKSAGKLKGWISYTLSWSNRKFAEISQGREFPFKYDRRHNLAIITGYDVTEKINVGLGWTYYTGSAFSLTDEKAISADQLNRLFDPFGAINGSTPLTNSYLETRNNYRMPDYHRLDVGINLKKKLKWAERTLSLGAYNAYSKKNAFVLVQSAEYDPVSETSRTVIKQLSIFPIVPYIRYSLKF